MSFPLFARLERRFGDPGEALTRREILRGTLAAGAGMLLSQTRPRAARAADGAKRVIVIGAGLGGVAAAYELKSAGYDVTIVEARIRLGGRVHSLNRFIKDKVVETGGELIGLNHPAWAAYADQFDLNLLPIPHDAGADMPIVLGGEVLEADKARALWKELKQGLAKINSDAERIVDPYEPWKTRGAKDLDRRTTEDWLARLSVSDLARKAMSIQLTAINGMLPRLQSYLANLAMVRGGGVEKYWTETDAQLCDGGAQQLPEEMSDRIGSHCFILNQAVTAVTAGDQRATVKLADGRELEADDVVVAVPVSTWKKIAFDPPLPDDFTPQMGLNAKFLALMKTRFWDQEQRSARTLSDGPISISWDATPNYPEEGGVCLTLYSGGPATETAIGWAADECREQHLAALEVLYPRVREQFVGGRFTAWHSDPFSLGSYSFPAPGEVTTIGPRLQEGLGRVHFAGEHCCYAFIGYMEGALQSGIRLARRLAKRDGVA